jgi:hypothetical protein
MTPIDLRRIRLSLANRKTPIKTARRAAAALAPGPAFPITMRWYLLTKLDNQS